MNQKNSAAGLNPSGLFCFAESIFVMKLALLTILRNSQTKRATLGPSETVAVEQRLCATLS